MPADGREKAARHHFPLCVSLRVGVSGLLQYTFGIHQAMHLSRMNDNLQLAVVYYTNGTIFRTSAEKLVEGLDLDTAGRPTTLMAIPLYLLASHAAELFLKAALLKRGFDEATLKTFGIRHNLATLLQELQGKGVPVTEQTVGVVQGLSEQHESHQLRYTVLVDDGSKTYWPPLPLVFIALDELLLLTRISTHGI